MHRDGAVGVPLAHPLQPDHRIGSSVHPWPSSLRSTPWSCRRTPGSAGSTCRTTSTISSRPARSTWSSRSRSVALAMVVAVPLALRGQTLPPTARSGARARVGVLYTIPALALISILWPVFGLTTVTVTIALAVYALLVVLRNTLVGLEGVPDDVVDAARGMGYGRRRLLWRVELPLALPAILAGVRLAVVSTVGLVTIGALVGHGGYGTLIVGGFVDNFYHAQIMTATLLTVALAIVLEGALLLLERVLTPWSRTRTAELVMGAAAGRVGLVHRPGQLAGAGRRPDRGSSSTCASPAWRCWLAVLIAVPAGHRARTQRARRLPRLQRRQRRPGDPDLRAAVHLRVVGDRRGRRPRRDPRARALRDPAAAHQHLRRAARGRRRREGLRARAWA